MSDSQRRFRGDAAPTRHKADLAELVELLLDKGIVVNADIVVTVGETELLGVYVRAAIASFETAAKYGLDFPEGTDMERVREAAGVEPLEGEPAEPGEQARLDELDIGVAQVEEMRVGSGGDDEGADNDGNADNDGGEAETDAATAEESDGDED